MEYNSSKLTGKWFSVNRSCRKRSALKNTIFKYIFGIENSHEIDSTIGSDGGEVVTLWLLVGLREITTPHLIVK